MKNTTQKAVMKHTITPPRLYQLFLVLMLLLYFLFPALVIITYPLKILGIVLLIGGAYLALTAKRVFKLTGNPILPSASPKTLLTAGPFSFTRNPMYLGITIGLLGVSILTGSVINFVFPALFMFIMNRYFIPAEEENLKDEFGEQFEEYKRQTRKWL